MPACTRKGDLGTGHGCFPGRPSNEGSSNVFVNSIPVHREGDSWSVHCCGDSCHSSTLSSGSSSVYINGKQCGRIGDPIACGSAVAQGSGNVYVGD